jgi:ATP-dependent Clp protease ATP-binding subunit ClpC
MYQRLSETAKDVLKIAESLAKRNRQEYIDTEHVLLAILEHDECIAARVLKDAQISLDDVKKQLESLNGNDKEEAFVLGPLRGTPHFEQAFLNAIEAAEAHRANSIGTEHLLIGLLRQTDCPAQQALAALGFTLDAALKKIQPQNTA